MSVSANVNVCVIAIMIVKLVVFKERECDEEIIVDVHDNEVCVEMKWDDFVVTIIAGKGERERT